VFPVLKRLFRSRKWNYSLRLHADLISFCRNPESQGQRAEISQKFTLLLEKLWTNLIRTGENKRHRNKIYVNYNNQYFFRGLLVNQDSELC
jgi:hypothetical protein